MEWIERFTSTKSINLLTFSNFKKPILHNFLDLFISLLIISGSIMIDWTLLDVYDENDDRKK